MAFRVPTSEPMQAAAQPPVSMGIPVPCALRARVFCGDFWIVRHPDGRATVHVLPLYPMTPHEAGVLLPEVRSQAARAKKEHGEYVTDGRLPPMVLSGESTESKRRMAAAMSSCGACTAWAIGHDAFVIHEQRSNIL